jgi:hypothetical protein
MYGDHWSRDIVCLSSTRAFIFERCAAVNPLFLRINLMFRFCGELPVFCAGQQLQILSSAAIVTAGARF